LKLHLKKDLKWGSPFSMFKNVIISDDLGSITQGVYATLEGMGITSIDKVHYCDDAYLKIKAAIHKKKPYDLVITDLSFKTDHRQQILSSGEALAELIKKEHPKLKVIVYSVEDRLQKVRSLIQKHKVDAYVCKGRHGLEELAKAVQAVAANEVYLSPQVARAVSPKTALEIDENDIHLLKQLANGLSQDEIAAYFKEHHIKPSSLSAIEKQLQKLRTQFKAKNATQLVATAKDLGVI
jgi:DNA-binding NarL/FixJ family response regulator